VSATAEVRALLVEYERALDFTDRLWSDLSTDEVHWRPDERASAIGWHLGHQAAVAHFLIRNLTAAEPMIDPPLDALMDSATPEPARGALPTPDHLRRYREAVAARVRARIGDIVAGEVGAPEQLAVVAVAVMTAIVNHEYQHDQWVGEVRERSLGRPLPARPTSPRLSTVDGYLVLTPSSSGVLDVPPG
jgi:hypothetical protein